MNNQNKAHNQKLRRNSRIFAVLMLLSQTAFSLLYSFTYSVKADTINVASIVNVICIALLVTAGFGLVISYLKRLLWSGLGFTFFITALAVEVYPLINNFWTRVRIHSTPTHTDFNTDGYQLFLVNSQLHADQLYGNCITNGFKCALAIVTAFSSILGRAGPLQCFIVTVVGTIGFELNRQIIMNFATDSFGTYFIFTFGGFMGLALGTILKLCREKVNNGSSTSRNNFNQSSNFSACCSLFGSLVIFALFPMLSYDVDSTRPFNTFYLQTGPLCILLGMSSSVMGAFCISNVINNSIILRDIIHAPIAGGIVVGSASFFITNPVYAIVAGFTAGSVQTLIQNLIEKPWNREKSVVSTVSWSLFGVQGLIGGIFATGYKHIIDSQSNGFTYHSGTINYNAGYELLMAVTSAGIGLGFGIIGGTIILAVSRHKSKDHFVDRTYWINDDGIMYIQVRTEHMEKIKKSISAVEAKAEANLEEKPYNDQLQDKNVIIEYSQVVPFTVSTPNFDMSFSDHTGIESKHTYL